MKPNLGDVNTFCFFEGNKRGHKPIFVDIGS